MITQNKQLKDTRTFKAYITSSFIFDEEIPYIVLGFEFSAVENPRSLISRSFQSQSHFLPNSYDLI
jgi:hypothetical protein